jgi:hypothetical protein
MGGCHLADADNIISQLRQPVRDVFGWCVGREVTDDCLNRLKGFRVCNGGGYGTRSEP